MLTAHRHCSFIEISTPAIKITEPYLQQSIPFLLTANATHRYRTPSYRRAQNLSEYLERFLFILSMVNSNSFLDKTATSTTTTTKKKRTNLHRLNLYPLALQRDCVLLFWIICHQLLILSANNIHVLLRRISLFCIITVQDKGLSLKQGFIHQLETYLLSESYIPWICENRDMFTCKIAFIS